MTTIPQPDALARFLAADEDEALSILQEEEETLLDAATGTALAAHLATEQDPARRELLAARQALLDAARQWRDQLATMNDAERLLLAFQSVANAVEMIQFAAGVEETALDTLEATVTERLTALAGEEAESEAAAGLRQRLESLRAIREQGVETLAAQLDSAMTEAAQQAQALASRLVAWIQTPGWNASEAFLQEHADELLTDASSATLQMLQEANQGNEEIALHINLLAACRQQGVAAAYAQLRQELAMDDMQALANRLVEWIQTPDWEASETFLQQHADELLTDAGATTLQMLQEANQGNEQIALHINLLAACRQQGIAAAYAQLRQEFAARATAEALTNNPLFQAVAEFLRAESDEEAHTLLETHRTLLLTTDARRHIEEFLAVARQQGDDETRRRVETRLALWQTQWMQKVGGPLRRMETAQQTESDQGWRERQERQAVPTEKESPIKIVTAINSAIGPHATVLNIYEVGDLPLRWTFPRQTRKRTPEEVVIDRLAQTFADDDLPTVAEVVARIKATPPNPAMITPPQGDLAEILRNSPTDPTFDLKSWEQEWAMAEDEMKRINFLNDIAEERA